MQKNIPSRFVGLAHVPPLGGRCGVRLNWSAPTGELGLKGVTISSQVDGLVARCERVQPFFESWKNQECRFLSIRHWLLKGYDLIKDYMLPVILTREFDLGVAVTRLIAGGVLERHATLKIVFAHFGGGMAGYKERISALILSFQACRSRLTIIFRSLYFDMAGFEGSPIALRCALEGDQPRAHGFCHRLPAELQQQRSESRQKHRRHPRIY